MWRGVIPSRIGSRGSAIVNEIYTNADDPRGRFPSEIRLKPQRRYSDLSDLWATTPPALVTINEPNTGPTVQHNPPQIPPQIASQSPQHSSSQPQHSPDHPL